jgi:hypothetical protein
MHDLVSGDPDNLDKLGEFFSDSKLEKIFLARYI